MNGFSDLEQKGTHARSVQSLSASLNIPGASLNIPGVCINRLCRRRLLAKTLVPNLGLGLAGIGAAARSAAGADLS